jgi:hypothetical protein
VLIKIDVHDSGNSIELGDEDEVAATARIPAKMDRFQPIVDKLGCTFIFVKRHITIAPYQRATLITCMLTHTSCAKALQ